MSKDVPEANRMRNHKDIYSTDIKVQGNEYFFLLLGQKSCNPVLNDFITQPSNLFAKQ